jgi:hypothetical protein
MIVKSDFRFSQLDLTDYEVTGDSFKSHVNNNLSMYLAQEMIAKGLVKFEERNDNDKVTVTATVYAMTKEQYVEIIKLCKSVEGLSPYTDELAKKIINHL